MTWIAIDAAELTRAGAALRDSANIVLGSRARILQVCGAPGLGTAGTHVTAGAGSVAGRLEQLAQDYLRQGISVLQRAITALQDQSLPRLAGSVTAPVAVLGAAMTIGGGSPGWSASPTAYGTATAVIGGAAPVWSTVQTVPSGSAGAVASIGGGAAQWAPVAGGAGGIAIIGGGQGWPISPLPTPVSVTVGGSSYDAGVSSPAGLAALQGKFDAVISRPQPVGAGGPSAASGLGSQLLAGMISAQTMRQVNATNTLTAANLTFSAPSRAAMGEYGSAFAIPFAISR